jgi:O-methyltransferase
MLRTLTNRLLGKRGRDLLWQAAQQVAYPPDFSAADVALCERVRALTMTSPERIAALAQAVRYVVANGLPGSFVECGVWRGGSMVAAALTLADLGDTTRDLYLFDTFEGMTDPTERDRTYAGVSADAKLSDAERKEGRNYWCIAGIDDVRANMAATGYPMERVHLVRGPVESTIPQHAPDNIALLRLDTDWYASTKHELEHLYPRLISQGVLIIDDYGHWEGARGAVDEYVGALSRKPLLTRIDYTGRCCVKP